ncbi:M20 family metallopeptidase [Cetobacterium sp. SF1]|uniref:M20 family metallopeptidase n=1 Tax=Cetobacterium sp. SF1 TaxID=3417654 RepID=UPI003CEAC951
MKERIKLFLDENKEKFIGISQEIYKNPEIGNKEYFASNLLGKTLEEYGFEVEYGIGGHETGFIGRKKSTLGPGARIAYLAEYDALPELGHGCGHNIIGAISVGGAIALGELLDEVPGEVVVYGCPAEEGGENGSAKGSYVRENLFDGIDVAMIIHPGSEHSATKNSLAVNPLDFEFFGVSSHAAAAPEHGKNALDALIHFFNGIGTLRQHVPSDVKIHGIITHGGEAPNIIPDYTKGRFFLRASTKEGCDALTEKVIRIAEGAALMNDCTVKVSNFQNRVDNLKPVKYFDEIYGEVMEELGIKINKNSKRGFGSTDVGNVSHVVPTIHPTIKICEENVCGHTVEFLEASGSPRGDEGVILGSKALGILGLKILREENILENIKREFKRLG